MTIAEFQAALTLLGGQPKQRLQGLEKLQELLFRVSLDRDHLSDLVECISRLVTDNNFKIAQYSLRTLDCLVLSQREAVKPFVNHFFDAVVERLGDMKQPVRMDAFPVLLSLMEVLKPDSVVERVGKFWSHKNWRIRHGLLQTFAEAVSKFGTDVLLSKSSDTNLIKQALRLTEDPDSTVRDAAVEFLEEAYRVTGNALIDIIKRSKLRPAVTKEILARLLPESEDQAAQEAGYEQPEVQEPAADVSRTLIGLQLQSTHPEPTRHIAEQPTVKVVDSINGAPAAVDSPAITVTSEKELKNELDKILVGLAPSVKWDDRNKAMQRLEALLNGGAAAYEAFPTLIRNLQDALAQQITDRRSAVVRQVCRVLSVMAAAMELEFEMLAAHFLPLLFKVLVITIQVMADAADMCIHHIVHYCHSPRLLSVFLHAATKDKNAKIRQCCAAYLVQLLEEWHPTIIAKHMEAVEEAVCVAAQGTLPQTRLFGRCAYAAYAHQQPERAQEILHKLAPSLQGKLVEAANSYQPGSAVGLKNLTFLPPPPCLVRSPAKAILQPTNSNVHNMMPDGNGLPYEPDAKPSHYTPRKSALQPDVPLQVPRGSISTEASFSLPSPRTPTSLSRGSSAIDLYAGWSLTKLVSTLSGESKSWAEKVALLTNIAEVLQPGAGSEGPEVVREVERAQPKLLECLDDAHYKVVCAALKAIHAMVNAAPTVVEHSADKLLPVLFQRLVDQKEQVRELAQDVIHGCGNRFSADCLLSGLTRTIDANKVPKARVAALEFSNMFLGHDTTAGAPTNSLHLRQWLAQIVPLLSDKTSEVRKAASSALSCTYRNMDNGAVLLHYAHAPKVDALAMKKALADHVSSLDTELNHYLQARNNAHSSYKPSTPSSSSQSRTSAIRSEVGYKQDDVNMASPEIEQGIPSSSTPDHSDRSSPHSSYRGALSDAPTSVFTALDSIPQSVLSSPCLESPESHAPEDFNAQAQKLAVLLARCQADANTESLHSLAEAAHSCAKAAWEPNISQAALVLLQSVKAHDASVKEAALIALRQVLAQQGDLLVSMLSSLLPLVLNSCGDSSKEVSFAAHGALEAMLGTLPASDCMRLLLARLPKPDSPIDQSSTEAEALSATLRALQQCTSSLPVEQLRAVTSAELFPWLLWAFDDARPDVRKAVTFCLVQLWLRLGDWLVPYLEKLGAPKLNLVTIYYNRAKAQAAAGFSPLS